MSNWYKLIYKQIEPIHIGSNKHGIINETKIFIPGITMWGALTNAYFKDTNIYDKEFFDEITCFFPMIDNEVLEPEFKNGEFYLGDKSEKEFRKDFTTTYLSTAINPSSLNANNESLHEIDIILPKNIYWMGYLKIDDESKIPKEIIVGGDSRYGFGKIILEKKEEENYPYSVKKGIYYNNYPNNEPLTNFVKFQNQNFEGRLEFMAEFNFYNIGTNAELKDNYGFYIDVGSKVFSTSF